MSRDRADFILCGSLVAVFALILTIVFVFSAPKRPLISNGATYAQVVRNFGGVPYDTGHFVSGYSCAGYTNGKAGHGWVVIRCQK